MLFFVCVQLKVLKLLLKANANPNARSSQLELPVGKLCKMADSSLSPLTTVESCVVKHVNQTLIGVHSLWKTEFPFQYCILLAVA